MIYLLNAPILTTFGTYVYKPIEQQEAVELLNEKFISGIGHETTASFLTKKLNIEVPTNRIKVAMKKGDVAIIFKLLGPRPAEGKIYTEKEIEAAGYEFQLIKKTED